MNAYKSATVAIVLALLAGGLASSNAYAASLDEKTVSPTRCTPVGPGTTLSELTINSFGVFNPGDTNETVICDIPVDSDVSWSSTVGASGNLQIYYRAGAVAGTVICTLFVGSTVATSGATFALTNGSGNKPAGSRNWYTLNVSEPSGLYVDGPPANVQCTITPKAALGAIFFHEDNVTTNTP